MAKRSNSAGTALATPAQVSSWVGRHVYTRWRYKECPDLATHSEAPTTHDYWYEPIWIVGQTGKRRIWLLVEDINHTLGASDGMYGYVDLQALEAHRGLVYKDTDDRLKPIMALYNEMPEWNRRQTIGYVLGVSSALKTLGLHDGDENNWELVKGVYRDSVRVHHPDRGGDPDKFKAVQGAWESLVRHHAGQS